MNSLGINWFDLVAAILILVGGLLGKKRGMSQELLPLFEWLVIVWLAGSFYQNLAEYLGKTGLFSALFSVVASYIIIGVLVKILFAVVKGGVGDKLVGSDLFGRSEYYLGFVAGALRFVCILICFLAVSGAPYISPEALALKAAKQKESLGQTFFPPLGAIQADIFSSETGKFTRKYLHPFLIQPVPASQKKLSDLPNPSRARKQREIDQFSK